MSLSSPPHHEELDRLFTQACEDYRNGLLESAGEAYRKLLEYCPDVPILHYNLGLVRYQQGEFEKACESFARAAELAPHDVDILFNLALSQKKCGNSVTATVTYLELLQSDPHNVDALYNLAGCYKDEHLHREAKEIYREVLRLAPDHPSANNNLAYLHHLDGEFEPALACYRKVLAQNPQHLAAAHMVAALTGAEVAGPPDAYVREVFDQYSDRFEESLVHGLKYRVPDLLRDFHDRTLGKVAKIGEVGHYALGLDLGCGTGLGGAAFTELVAVFDGLDLSAKMLAIAEGKNIYRHLYHGSIAEILTAVDSTFDFILASDVFIYAGELETTFRLLRERASADAVFCFSTEFAAGEGFQLQQNGRFAHSPEYIRQTAQATGWQVEAAETAQIRKEQGEWVEGALWIFRPVESF